MHPELELDAGEEVLFWLRFEDLMLWVVLDLVDVQVVLLDESAEGRKRGHFGVVRVFSQEPGDGLFLFLLLVPGVKPGLQKDVERVQKGVSVEHPLNGLLARALPRPWEVLLLGRFSRWVQQFLLGVLVEVELGVGVVVLVLAVLLDQVGQLGLGDLLQVPVFDLEAALVDHLRKEFPKVLVPLQLFKTLLLGYVETSPGFPCTFA